jgi:hypothetical protein
MPGQKQDIEGTVEDLLAIDKLDSVPAQWTIVAGYQNYPVNDQEGLSRLLRQVGVRVQFIIRTWATPLTLRQWESVKEIRWYPKVDLMVTKKTSPGEDVDRARRQDELREYKERLHGRWTQVALVLMGQVQCPRLYGRAKTKELTNDLLRAIVLSLS